MLHDFNPEFDQFQKHAGTQSLAGGELLRPGGFEGFGFLMREVRLESCREAVVVQRPDNPVVDFQLDAARRSPYPAVLIHQDLVALDAELP
jgi:hypothetical protein